MAYAGTVLLVLATVGLPLMLVLRHRKQADRDDRRSSESD